MNMTSLQRLIRYLAPRGDTKLTNNEPMRRDLIRWIGVASNRIEQYLGRTITKATGIVEYFDIGFGQREFFPLATPVTAITSVYTDSSGEFDGGESELTDNFIGLNGLSVVLVSSVSFVLPRSLQMTYSGGLADTGVYSTFAVADSSAWTVGKFVYGSNSGALGLVNAVPSATSLKVEVLYGVFEIGETLTEQDTEDAVGAATGSSVLSAKTATALCEAYPDITTACEMQIRYLWQNRDTYENTGVSKDGSTNRGQITQYPYSLQPEVISLLEPYRRIVI